MNLEFPKNFYFGAATSAHQVEGGNKNDWTEWEKKSAKRKAQSAKLRNWPDYILESYPSPLTEENHISGIACDHYNRFREDFDIAKSLGHNAYRMSVEWSRIEPEEGRFDLRSLEHYRDVVFALRERGMEPFVALWHWTFPLWMRDLGGLESKKFPYFFARFARRIVQELGGVNFWITLNEPTSVVGNAYVMGRYPPEKKSLRLAYKVTKNLAVAHKAAYGAIKELNPQCHVGIAHNMIYLEPRRDNFLDRLACRCRDFLSNEHFLRLLGGSYDFLGLQYYRRLKISFPQKIHQSTQNLSDMGWEIFPEGIYHLIKKLSKYKKPIYITENGVADLKDLHRAKFVEDHLRWVSRAIREGSDVRGYFYWSLLDNFEWEKGFWPRFGLVGVDYKTQERKIRESAYIYKKIIKGDVSIVE